MSVNTNYSYLNAAGFPGKIDYQSPRHIVARTNEAALSGCGIFVATGSDPGKTVKVPSATGIIEGVLINQGTTELSHPDGKFSIPANTTVSVMRYGHVWVKLAQGADPSYGDKVHVVYTGNEAGYATDSETGAVAIDGIFVSEAEDGIALVELRDSVVDVSAESGVDDEF